MLSLGMTISFGLLELGTRSLIARGILKHDPPMITVMINGSEDWRKAHITADRLREPDPVLFWRPIGGYPFNSQRFKGPIAEVPKPPDLFRIMAYGDSNTEGPDEGAWPQRLHELLNQPKRRGPRRFEVINAGVAGYSSYQGLMRFRAEVQTYRPDLVLVSFGWNDLPEALGQPDEKFHPPGPIMTSTLRWLLRSELYLTLRYYLTPSIAPSTPSGAARVSLEDYEQNLGGFLEEGRKHGAPVIFLTRPHQRSEARIALDPSWRKNVPGYNRRVREFAARMGARVIDVRKIFHDRFPGLFEDECHFTSEGHRRMAEMLATELVREGALVLPTNGS